MSKVIALTNQKGGTGKTTTAVNLGIGFAAQGKKVLLVDADAQGNLTDSLGYREPDNLSVSLATILTKTMMEEPYEPDEGILPHLEGVDLMPGNIELSAIEVSLVNTMSRLAAETKALLPPAYAVSDEPPKRGKEMNDNLKMMLRGRHGPER